MPLRACDPHVEQPAFFGELVGLLRLPDRQQPLLERRQEHGLPFEALGPVVRREHHARGSRSDGRRLGCVARVELGEEGRPVGARRRDQEIVEQGEDQLERGRALARLLPALGPERVQTQFFGEQRLGPSAKLRAGVFEDAAP